MSARLPLLNNKCQCMPICCEHVAQGAIQHPIVVAAHGAASLASFCCCCCCCCCVWPAAWCATADGTRGKAVSECGKLLIPVRAAQCCNEAQDQQTSSRLRSHTHMWLQAPACCCCCCHSFKINHTSSPDSCQQISHSLVVLPLSAPAAPRPSYAPCQTWLRPLPERCHPTAS